MSLQTTVVGSWPKPDYLTFTHWFKTGHDFVGLLSKANEYLSSKDQEKQRGDVERAVKDCIQLQKELGLDIVTDGEMGRETYIHHFCRQLDGYNFDTLTEISCRDGACKYLACTATSRLKLFPGAVEKEVSQWKMCQTLAGPDTPVKFTLPGPMTIINTSAETYYAGDVKKWSSDLVSAINEQVLSLDSAGCRHVQIDEPLMVRQPDVALDYGIDHLVQCFKGCSSDVVKTVHLCCGYPRHIDDIDYQKAPPESYLKLASRLDKAGFHAVSIEDAHRHNDLSLFKQFEKTSVIVGSVQIASSRVETVEEIKTRLKEILTVLPAERLMVAPDCGLGFLPADILRQKLTNMVEAASRAINEQQQH